MTNIAVLLFCVTGVYGFEAGTFYDQWKNCESIQNPDQPEIHLTLTTLLQEAQLESVWLPIKKHDLDGWRWLKGNQFYNSYISSPGSTNPWHNCGVFRILEAFRTIDDVSCSKKVTHFLCQKTDSCGTDLNCFQNSEQYYTVHAIRSTWHEARDLCHSQGAILASIESNQKVAVALEIEKIVKQSVNIWIGLRNADYVLITAQQENSSEPVRSSMWEAGYPCQCPDDVCVVLTRNSHDNYRWRTENCTANHTIICQQDVLKAISAQTSPITTAPPSGWLGIKLETDMLLIIVGASVGGIFIIILIAMCCCSCCQHKKKLKYRGGPWNEYYTPKEGETFLLKPKYGANNKQGSHLYYAQLPGKAGTLSNPNIPAGIEPTDFTLTAVLKRPKATIKQQEHMKQEYKASGEMTEACFEWIVKDLDEHLLVNNEQTSFMRFALGQTETTAEVLRRRYVMDCGVAAIYQWRGGDPVNQSWYKLHQIIHEYKYFNLQPWLQELFR